MKYGKLLGWGIVIYAVMYLVASALSLYMVAPFLARAIALISLVTLTTIAGLSLKRHAAIDILPYSLAWTVQVALLDALMSVPYAGWGLYLDWNVWAGYLLVLVVPLLSAYAFGRPISHR